MSKFRNYLLFIIFLAAAAAIIGSQAKAWSIPKKPNETVNIRLTEISKNPHALMNNRITLRCRFAARGELFRKNDNIFNSKKFENFVVWDKEIQFWNNNSLKTVYPTFYIAKNDTHLAKQLRKLERFNKIEITGTVESVYANMPWIKVEELKLIEDDSLDQAMASQIKRGVEFVNTNDFQKAKICFEIALERKAPKYVEQFVFEQHTKIKETQKSARLAKEQENAKEILQQARAYASEKDYEKAATAYGKAIKTSTKFNNSAAIHKEIAGFFIDFYKATTEDELLDYSIKEFKNASKLIKQKDCDILYALAYIETLKAKKSHNYQEAERLAKECLQLNEFHYGGRKLLSEILSSQLNNSQAKQAILKPTQQLPSNTNTIQTKDLTIDNILEEENLLAMESDIEKLDNSLHTASITLSQIKEKLDNTEIVKDEEIVGMTAADFQGLLHSDDTLLEELIEKEPSDTAELDTELPDFPTSATAFNSNLPKLAM